jgi:hypothetical protein
MPVMACERCQHLLLIVVSVDSTAACRRSIDFRMLVVQIRQKEPSVLNH